MRLSVLVSGILLILYACSSEVAPLRPGLSPAEETTEGSEINDGSVADGEGSSGTEEVAGIEVTGTGGEIEELGGSSAMAGSAGTVKVSGSGGIGAVSNKGGGVASKEVTGSGGQNAFTAGRSTR